MAPDTADLSVLFSVIISTHTLSELLLRSGTPGPFTTALITDYQQAALLQEALVWCNRSHPAEAAAGDGSSPGGGALTASALPLAPDQAHH